MNLQEFIEKIQQGFFIILSASILQNPQFADDIFYDPVSKKPNGNRKCKIL